MPKITMLTGGVRSGKSSYALEIAEQYTHKTFIATAVAFDDEMRQRITAHKLERDASYVCIEEPLNLAGALHNLGGDTPGVVVIDCLTVWMGNLLHEYPDSLDADAAVDAFIHALAATRSPVVVVTNEVGLGIIPDNELARMYQIMLGKVNRKIAAIADTVILMVSGIPVVIKHY
jgi:adenosylcobinamide kinase/adenosylcobinamide-phosphate guanylyltransferase